ncbi:uncharacterized protein DNG_02751 [Cephalotrichum gorgonifer]|uniref:Sensitive to high expression protein 9, mitochondrial n=1 Tax=Cephalotrichum gorgonifer TaxID=2041049 RepID=A0AAE8MT05_9PEZI|nr:uncharacterized protein DNG_02751 [Cephalotrichum gorgonifer]
MASSIFRPLWTTGGAVRLTGKILPRSQLGVSRESPRLVSLWGPTAPWPRSSFVSRPYSSSPSDRKPSGTSPGDPASSPTSEPTSSPASSEPTTSDPASSDSSSEPTTSPTSSHSPSDPTSPVTDPSSQSGPDSPQAPNPEATPGQDPDLPSSADSRRAHLMARFSNFMDNLQDRYVSGIDAFNSLTGYSSIEAITANNSRLERSLASARADMRTARQSYQDTVAAQVATQRDMATLLARKASWVQSDKNRFAELIEDDYRLEREVGEASKAVEAAEASEQSLLSEWVAGMSKQYYEHQVYSDRIRRASTWGTWGLMGVNVLLFLTLQFVAEPWKRGRLLNSMEEREEKLFDRIEGRLEEGLGRMRTEMKDAVTGAGEGSGEVSAEVAVADSAVAPPPARTWEELFWDPRLLWGVLTGAFDTLRAELRLKDYLGLGISLLILLRTA